VVSDVHVQSDPISPLPRGLDLTVELFLAQLVSIILGLVHQLAFWYVGHLVRTILDIKLDAEVGAAGNCGLDLRMPDVAEWANLDIER
jgi:hypothetical protein